MRLAERKLGGSTGIAIGVEQTERLKELKRRILAKKDHVFEMSASDVIAAMLDAEGVDQGQWKEKWEDLPKQLGKPRPDDWVPQALGDITMEEVLGYKWRSKVAEGKVSQFDLLRFLAMAELEDTLLIRKAGVSGTDQVRVSQKQRQRLRILGRAQGIWKTTDIISYLLDQAGISYGTRMTPRKRALRMLRGEADRFEKEGGKEEGFMDDTPQGFGREVIGLGPILPEEATAPEDPALAQATPGGPIESQVTEEPAPDIGHIAKEPT